jgi:hypothetical protein
LASVVAECVEDGSAPLAGIQDLATAEITLRLLEAKP